jgi:excisionase family DNA binding protein
VTDDAPALTIKEVARRLQVSQKTIRRWVHAGTFPPPVYLGIHPRWHERDVSSFFWLKTRLSGAPFKGKIPIDDEDEEEEG